MSIPKYESPRSPETGKKRSIPEIDSERKHVHEDAVEPLKEEDRDKVHKEILKELKHSANSEARVRTFARLMDTYGLDPIVSLIPALGDGGATGLAGLYLLFEAKRSGLGASSYIKIIGLQAADFFAGAIPIVGDVADFFFKANKWCARDFEKKTEELVAKAMEAGVPERDIEKIRMAADKLPKLVEKGVRLYAEKKKTDAPAEGSDATA